MKSVVLWYRSLRTGATAATATASDRNARLAATRIGARSRDRAFQLELGTRRLAIILLDKVFDNIAAAAAQRRIRLVGITTRTVRLEDVSARPTRLRLDGNGLILRDHLMLEIPARALTQLGHNDVAISYQVDVKVVMLNRLT